MSLDEYKLSAELMGHSMDVRAVAVAENYIVSGSRDRTCKIWQHDGESWSERYTLANHTNYVSAVCILGDNEWICTASNDKTILIYADGNRDPFKKLVGHLDTVSCIAPGLASDTLISGSWDNKVIIWSNILQEPTKMTLEGHEAAVWAVTTMDSGKYVSGGADKNIIVWSKAGERLRVIKGSKDCVRALLSLPNDCLISAGNDALIRYWNEDGECMNELSGHTNFIYSMAFNKALGANIIVSGSEDSTLRMWNGNGEIGKAITIPALSVWSVACMKNGDIVTGSSDGIVRVFTKDPSRVASDETMAAFNQAVEAYTRDASKKLGDVKVNELPGPDALFQKGKSDGETKMVRQADGKIMCYQWNGGKWEEIGDVVGASGGSQAAPGKKLHNGKEYDYVFDVNIADDAPALKLPYNRTDDPYVSAQKFIHENQLPQTYLEEIANFIITNAKPVLPLTGTGQTSEYQDPFTGAGRYIPGSSSNDASGGMNVDPFTGGSSYSTSSSSSVPVNFVTRSGQNLDPFTGASSHTSQPSTKTPRKHCPFAHYTTLDVCDAEKILKKLREFNEQVPESLRASEAELLQAIKLAQNDHTASSSIDALKKLLQWPTDFLFPVLDIVRLAVLDPNTCTNLVTPEILNFIVQNCKTGAANQLMSLRCLSNMLKHGYGRGLIETVLSNILVAISATKKGTSNLQMAIATTLLNLSVGQLKRPNEQSCHQITETLIDFLLWASDPESLYRCYRSLGNLLSTQFGPSVSAQIISTDEVTEALRDNVKAPQSYEFDKINQIAQEIMDSL